MLNSENYLTSIIHNLSIIKFEIETRGKLGLTDLNKYCENFFAGILNRLYNLDLINLNNRASNYPALDLGDLQKGIAFQVTSDKSGRKVSHTLKLVVQHNLHEKFKEIYILILGSKQKSYTVSQIEKYLLRFDPNINILCLI